MRNSGTLLGSQE